MDTHELDAIRARVADEYEGALFTSDFEGMALADLRALLAHIDRLQAIEAAAGEYLSAEPGTHAQYQALDKLHDALKGAGDGPQTK